jgi:hypothetical protein
MFIRAASVFALAALPLARSAYTVDTPQVWYANISNVVSWNSLTTDPAIFSVELIPPQNVGGAYAIANNVNADLLSILVPLPRVPASGGYILHLVNPGNISDIYARSGEFPILDNPTDSQHPQGTAPTLTGASTAPPLPSQPSTIPPTTTGNSTATTASAPTTAAPLPTSTTPISIPTGTPKPFGAAFANSVPVGSLALAFAAALAL